MPYLSNEKLKIAVFGHYGNRNLGDESIVSSTIQNIKKRLPESTIIGMSIRPEDTRKRHGIESFPIRFIPIKTNINNGESSSIEYATPQIDGLSRSFVNNGILTFFTLVYKKIMGRVEGLITSISNEIGFCLKSRKLLRDVDLVIVAGSNQFLDNFGGVMGFPYTLLKWSLLCFSSNTKIVYLSVGAGPLDSIVSKLLVRIALLLSHSISYRDAASKNVVENSFYKLNSKIYPDLAHGLTIENNRVLRCTGQVKEIAINPMPLYDSRYWYISDDEKYNSYTQKLADFSNYLLIEGYNIRFFGTHPRDDDVICDVIDKMSVSETFSEDRVGIFKLTTVNELLVFLQTVDITVATRFHGELLSLLCETPVLGVCYYRKAYDLMQDMGQESYCVNSDDFEVSDLLCKFEALKININEERTKIIEKNKEYKVSMDSQFDSLFESLF